MHFGGTCVLYESILSFHPILTLSASHTILWTILMSENVI